MTPVLSPLRYPGSKARLAALIASLLEKNLLVGSHIYEPFAGGAAASINLLANGFVASATWVERDPLVFSFWHTVKVNPEPLIKRILNGKVTLQSWKRLLPLREVKRPTAYQVTEMAYAGLFFNRTCFSGIVGAGPIGGQSQSSMYKIDCRFNKATIVKSIEANHLILKKVDILFGDGITFLARMRDAARPHSFAYIDPPYVANGHKLYRYSFSKGHHERLAAAVTGLRLPWMVSYDNHKLVRELYNPARTSTVSTYHALKGAKFVDELLMLSDDFILPERTSIADKRPNAAARIAGIVDGSVDDPR
jgi:DNA adenine methylase